MSSMIYISCDVPIPEIQNPHARSLSINEALELGLEIPEYLLKNGIDRNWKNAIYWSDRNVHFDLDRGIIEDGDLDDDFSILPILPGSPEVYSAKQHQACVECIWTLGRANRILGILRQLLELTKEVEFWNIYMDNGERPKIIQYSASIDTFTPEDLMEISALPTYDQGTIHHCVTIRR